MNVEGAMAGTFFWSIVGSTIPDYDGYSVHLSAHKQVVQTSCDDETLEEPPEEKALAQSLNSGIALGDQGQATEHGNTCSRDSEPISELNQVSGTEASSCVAFDELRAKEVWLDEELVTIIKEHCGDVASLNGSWTCPVM